MTEKLHILLLEDSPFDAFLLRSSLSKSLPGASLVHAERLEDALWLLQEHSIDLILTDLNLPDSFGIDTVRALLRNAGGIPVVVLTGDNTPELEEQLAAERTSGHVMKDQINTPAFPEVIDRAMHRLRPRTAD